MILRFRWLCGPVVLQRSYTTGLYTEKSPAAKARVQLLIAAKGKSHSELCYAMRAAGKVKLSLSPDDCESVFKAFISFIHQHRQFNAYDICDVMYGTIGMCNVEKMPLFRPFVSSLTSAVLACSDMNTLHVSRCFTGLQNFSDRGNVPHLLDALVDIALKQESQLTSRILSNMLHGLRSMSGNSTSTERALMLILKNIENSTESWNNRDIGAAYTGLRNKRSSHSIVRRLVLALALKFNSMEEPVSSLALCTALQALKNMNNEHDEIVRALDIICFHIALCSDDFSRNDLAMAFNGLQNMSSTTHTRRLLRELAKRLEACTNVFSPPELASVLYGVKNFPVSRVGDHGGAIREVLVAIVPHIRTSIGKFNSQTFGNCLYGMNGKSSNVVEVLDVMRALLERFQDSVDVELEPLALSTALYGLKDMSTTHTEVRAMLEFLTQKLRMCRKPFRPGDLSMAMIGLSHCDSDYQETRKVVAELTKKMKECDDSLLERHVSYFMLGIRNMSDKEPEVYQLLELYVKKFSKTAMKKMSEKELPACFGGMSRLHINNPNTQALLELFLSLNTSVVESWSAESISTAMSGLSSMSDDHPLVRRTLQALLHRAMNCRDSWSVDALCKCFHGVASMTANTPEVVLFLQFAVGELVMMGANLKPPQIRQVLYSMSNMTSDSPAVRSLIVLLSGSINQYTGGFDVEIMEHSFFGIRNMSSEHDEVMQLLAALTRQLAKYVDSIDEVSLNYFLEGLRNKSTLAVEVREAYDVLGKLLDASQENIDLSLIESWCTVQDNAQYCETVRKLVNIVRNKASKH